MKALALSACVVVLSLTIGCSSPGSKGHASDPEAFRKQLAETVFVQKYGYNIKDVRFSSDQQKVLVTFSHPDWKPGDGPVHINSSIRPDIEAVLVADEFGRYVGAAHQPFYTPGSSGDTPFHTLIVDLHRK